MFRAIRSINAARWMPRTTWNYDVGRIRLFSIDYDRTKSRLKPPRTNQLNSLHNKNQRDQDLSPVIKLPELIQLLTNEPFHTRQSRAMLNEKLYNFASSSPLVADSQLHINLLQLLASKGFKTFPDQGVKLYIDNLFRNLRGLPEFEDKSMLDLLEACVRLEYNILLPGAVNEFVMKDLIIKISNEYLLKDFSTYCEFFYVVGKLRVPWRTLPREKRENLLSSLKQFKEIHDRESVRLAEKLICGIDELLILKQGAEYLDDEARETYERILMKVLETRHSQTRRYKITGENDRLPIISAILFQLRSLANLRGKERLTQKQLELIYLGFREDWEMEGMDSSKQVLAVVELGDMRVNYRSLPEGLWSMMMDDLIKKMQNRIKPIVFYLLLKGWKGMGYKWKDMEDDLKTAVLNAAADICRDERNARQISTLALYFGYLQVNWKEDVKGKYEEILDGIALASKNIDSQGLSNSLLGLSNMKATWKGMSGKVQNSLLVAIEDKCKDMNDQDISNNLYSLGQLGIAWENIPRSLQENLLQSLRNLVSSLKVLGINGSINGLNTMGYNWTKDEELYESILKKIEGYYANKAKMNKMNQENLPALVYSLGEGKVQWKELRAETKQALMNGMEAYCKGEDVDAKKVSNMIYGLGNMGATIHNIPALMKELLEGAVRKIARKNYDPQAVANIMYSFSQMQYSWEMVGEETREELLQMIRQSCREFNAQELSNICLSIAVMTRDNRGEWEKNYFIPLQEGLLRRYYELEKKRRGKGAAFLKEDLSQLSVYLSWLETLPASSLSSLLQSLKQDKLPDIEDPRITQPSSTHKQFSDSLRGLWRDKIEKEVREGKMSEEKKERMMKVKIVDEYIGLSRKMFPMDIAVVEDVVGLGGESEEKVWLFIEIDGDYHKHTMKFKRMKDGSVKPAGKILATVDQLKEYLYGEKYKDVPVRRCAVKDIDRHLVNEIVEKLWKDLF